MKLLPATGAQGSVTKDGPYHRCKTTSQPLAEDRAGGRYRAECTFGKHYKPGDVLRVAYGFKIDDGTRVNPGSGYNIIGQWHADIAGHLGGPPFQSDVSKMDLHLEVQHAPNTHSIPDGHLAVVAGKWFNIVMECLPLTYGSEGKTTLYYFDASNPEKPLQVVGFLSGANLFSGHGGCYPKLGFYGSDPLMGGSQSLLVTDQMELASLAEAGAAFAALHGGTVPDPPPDPDPVPVPDPDPPPVDPPPTDPPPVDPPPVDPPPEPEPTDPRDAKIACLEKNVKDAKVALDDGSIRNAAKISRALKALNRAC